MVTLINYDIVAYNNEKLMLNNYELIVSTVQLFKLSCT